MATIKLVEARYSRGNPTVEVDIYLFNGYLARAAVPSGASTGVYEALELCDGGKNYMGKGVSKAVENVNKIIGPALSGKDPVDQTGIDNFMVQELDGTQNQWGWCKQKVSTSVVLCYIVHHYEYPENVGASPRNAVVAPAGEEAEIEEEILPERGESLVVNRVLMKQSKEINEPAQRKNLFKNICKVQGKCFQLVIDSGSTNNLVSTEVIEQLKLKTRKHPNPYMVSWVQEGHQLIVEEQCEIELQMRKYKDKVMCDVLPMDVCHILLGRPWQYDRFVLHDGRLNTYMVLKDEVYYLLKPMEEAEPSSGVIDSMTLLLSGKEYLQQIEEEEAVIKKKYGQDATNVGDEGGFAPNIQENKEGLESLKIAIEKAGYTGKVVIGMGVAASEFYTEKNQKYDLNFKEEVNQIGSVTESIEAVMSKRGGWGVMTSHRSGETKDTFIADLAVGLATGQIKTGAPCRSE